MNATLEKPGVATRHDTAASCTVLASILLTLLAGVLLP